MNKGWAALPLFILIWMFGLTGCRTGTDVAFPNPQALASSTIGRLDLATLERGRKLYTTRCTECHVARPIASLTVPQWRKAVAMMAPRADLNPTDREALEAYLIAAREALSGRR